MTYKKFPEIQRININGNKTFYRFTPCDDITPTEAAFAGCMFAMAPHLSGPEEFAYWGEIERHFEFFEEAVTRQ
jgi:uncharacterized protein YllA (UPF0747 family)